MSGIGTDRLIFDPADTTGSSNVGAYLRSSDGTLLTHTNANAKQALDVYLQGGEPLSVTFDDPVKYLLDGVLTSVEEDTVTPANSTPLPVKLISAGGEINVTAGDINVQLSHTGANFDSTRVGDGTTTWDFDADGKGEVVLRADSSVNSQSVTVTDTSAAILSGTLAKRKWVEIQNQGNKEIYLGASGVAVGTGIRISRGGYWKGEVGPSVALHAVAPSGASVDVAVVEFA